MTEKEAQKLAGKISKRIWLNLSDRRGVGDELALCDDEIQDEIRREMVSAAFYILTGKSP